ncbi:MAG: MoxR family ATPase [Verrucomicrobiae bacterium]|nr:MoxR family ATPase [Verrucomicrobiae bacterium]
MDKPAVIQTDEDLAAAKKLADARERMMSQIGRVIVGQKEVVEQMLIGMFSRGHCLLVGVPGLAKTLLVRTVSQLLHLSFKRIQFTPDLMPSDITGTDVIEESPDTGKRQFRFIKGALFANMVLADEINRTPPKTQAALLEAMQEYHVTAGGNTYELPLPFFVLATQNPIEQEGTYPLPEAQLDRFMFNVIVDYPTEVEEREIVRSTTTGVKVNLEPVLSGEEILRLQEIVRKVPAANYVIDYAVALTRATRPGNPKSPQFIKDWVSWGAGPRAAQYLIIGGKARALMNGRFNVSCEDIRAIAKPVLYHRFSTNFTADSEGIKPDDIITRLLKETPEPAEEKY